METLSFWWWVFVTSPLWLMGVLIIGASAWITVLDWLDILRDYRGEKPARPGFFGETK